MKLSIVLVLILSVPMIAIADDSTGDFQYDGVNDPPVFISVYEALYLVTPDTNVLFDAIIQDVDNSSSELEVYLFHSRDGFTAENYVVTMSFNSSINIDTNAFVYFFPAQPVGTSINFYYEVRDGASVVTSPVNANAGVYYTVQWGQVTPPDGKPSGSSSGGGDKTDLPIYVNVFEGQQAVSGAFVTVKVSTDSSGIDVQMEKTTITDSGGFASVRITADIGDYVIAVATEGGREGSARQRVASTSSAITLTINIAIAPIGFNTPREFLTGLGLFVGVAVLGLLVYTLIKRNFDQGGGFPLTYGRRNAYRNRGVPKGLKKQVSNSKKKNRLDF